MVHCENFRIYPNALQKQQLNIFSAVYRWTYNWALEQKILYFQANRRQISSFDLMKRLTQLKKQEEYAWLKDAPCAVTQVAICTVDVALSNFFRKLARFPKFKAKKSSFSFGLPSCRVNWDKNSIDILRLFGLKARLSRRFPGPAKSTKVMFNPAGQYFVSIVFDDGDASPEPQPATLENAVGLDIGVNFFATLSTGEKIHNPRCKEKLQPKINWAQRKASRKQKKSRNREKCNRKTAKLYLKATNQLKDFQHKLSTRLIRENQTICLETLNIIQMIRSQGKKSKGIRNASWTGFIQMLRNKAKKRGVNIIHIGRWLPSSKMCSCGVVNKTLKRSQLFWTCKSCGCTHDRDILAANNIRKFAFETASSVGPDRPEVTLAE